MKLKVEINDAYKLSTHTELKTTTYTQEVIDPQESNDTYNEEFYNYPDCDEHPYSNMVWGKTSSGYNTNLKFYSLSREGFNNPDTYTVNLPGYNNDTYLVRADNYSNLNAFYFDLLGELAEEDISYNIYNKVSNDGVEIECHDVGNINLRYMVQSAIPGDSPELSDALYFCSLNSSTPSVGTFLSPSGRLTYVHPGTYGINLYGGRVPVPSGILCSGWGWFSANVYAESVKVDRDRFDNVNYYYNDGDLGFYPNSVYMDEPVLVNFKFLGEDVNKNHPGYSEMFSFYSTPYTVYVGGEEETRYNFTHAPRIFNTGMYGFLESYRRFKAQYVEGDESTHIWTGERACALGYLTYDVPLPTIPDSYYSEPYHLNNPNLNVDYYYGIVDIDKCEELCRKIEQRAKIAVSHVRLIPTWNEENTKVYSKGDVTVTQSTEENTTILTY